MSPRSIDMPERRQSQVTSADYVTHALPPLGQ